MILFLFISSVISTCVDKLVFTECSELGLRKALIYKEGDCPSSLPSVYPNLDCDFSCKPGHFLNFINNQQVCSKCPAGTYSLGGSLVIGLDGTPFQDYLPKLVNLCWDGSANSSPNTNCSNWIVSNSFLVSGSSSTSYISSLSFPITLKKSGKFTLIYRNEAETPQNSLEFSIKINKIKKLTDSSTGKIWNRFSEKLDSGTYQIEIKFTNGGQGAKSLIHSITVEGAFFSDTICKKCHNSIAVSGNCMACDFNEYLDQGKCLKCPIGTYSHRGATNSSACMPRPSCTVDDFVQLYSACKNAVRTIYYEWKTPMLCDDSSIDLPPSISSLPCESCSAGHIEVQNGAETECLPCQNGEYSTGTGKYASCQKCAAGTISQNQVSYNNWTGIPQLLSTYCTDASGNFCQVSDGWVAKSSYLSTGAPPSSVHLYLESKINIVSFVGTFNFTYEIKAQNPVSFEVYINGSLYKALESQNKAQEIIFLTQGTHLIQLIYTASTDPAEVRVYQITVSGSELGGASSCIQCPVGFSSATGSASCFPCPASSTSSPDNSQCIACGNGTVSHNPGSKCSFCPLGSTSNSDSTMCIAKSVLNFTNSSYLLYPLSNTSLNTGQENVCSAISSQLYCFGTFYGPISSRYGDFYLSVINPSLLELPGVSYYGTPSAGYGYGVVKEKGKVIVENKDICKQDEKIVNLGQKVLSVNENFSGFTVNYTEGDLCDGEKRFASSLNIICDKTEEFGWPAVSSFSDCLVEFTWKTRFGCKICAENDIKKVIGECKDGQQEVTVVEAEDCVLGEGSEKFTQKCKNGEYKEEVLVGFAVLGFFAMFGLVLGAAWVQQKKVQVPLEDVLKPN